MALSYTVNRGGAYRSVDLAKGLKIAQAKITIGAVTDYAAGSGLLVDEDALGFTKIWAIVGATLHLANGTNKLFVPFWNYQTGRLRFMEQNAGAGAFDELDQADLAANDFVECIVIGIG